MSSGKNSQFNRMRKVSKRVLVGETLGRGGRAPGTRDRRPSRHTLRTREAQPCIAAGLEPRGVHPACRANCRRGHRQEDHAEAQDEAMIFRTLDTRS